MSGKVFTYPASTTYGTHLWVSLTSTATPLKNITELDLLSYQESRSVGGDHSINLTLSGRAKAGQKTQPWIELLNPGDLIRVGASNTGVDGGRPFTLAEDAVVQSVSVGESLQDGSYSFTTQISAQGLQSVLMQDAVAWWMYYGTAIGALKTQVVLMPDDVSGKLDKVFANYLTRVAFEFSNWQRDGVGLAERLGYHLSSLHSNVPVLRNLTIAEGPHWNILQQYAEQPLHEFFVQYRRKNDPNRPMIGGFAHHPEHRPEALVSSQDARTGSGDRPYIVFRPAPFPFADKNGKPVMSEWEALPMHDLTDLQGTTGNRTSSTSLQGVKNYVLVSPAYDLMNQEMAYTLGIAVSNTESIRRYGYMPAKVSTNLILNDGPQQSIEDLAHELTWRLATQFNQSVPMNNVSLSVPLNPNIQPGDRARFRLLVSEEGQSSIYLGYVSGVSHAWQQGQGGTTTLQLERCLPETTYQDPSFFVEGLGNVRFKGQAPTHGA